MYKLFCVRKQLTEIFNNISILRNFCINALKLGIDVGNNLFDVT